MSHEHHHEHECDCHEHHHEHEEGGLKQKLILIAVTAVLLVAAVLIEKKCNLATWQLLLVYLVPYLLIGFDTLKEAAEGMPVAALSSLTSCHALNASSRLM